MDMLLDKTYACLGAAALGDAMGAPLEFWHFESIREKHGVVRDLLADKGVHLLRRGLVSYHWTDDTVLTHQIVRAIVKRGGRINACDLRQVWMEELNPGATNPLDSIVFMKLAAGTPARENGEGMPVSATAAMSIAPIGIINACDPMSAAADAFDVASMTQWKEGREAAMAVAAGVAAAFEPGATRERVAEAALANCGPLVRKHIARAIEIAKRYANPVDMIPEYYQTLLVEDGWSAPVRNDPELRKRIKTEKWSFSCHPLECVPVAFGMFYASEGNAMESIIGSINFGRDCDTIAGIAGALAAAMTGTRTLDLKLVGKTEQASGTSLLDLAQQLQPAIVNVLHARERSVAQLRSLRVG